MVADISDPSSPQAIGDVELPARLEAVEVSGRYVYVADGRAGFRVVDVSTPSAPVEVGFLDTPGTAEGLAVEAGYAFLADGLSGMRVIDVADPSVPQLLGSFQALGPPGRVAVLGDLAYFAAGRLWVVDMSEAPPSLVSFFDPPAQITGVSTMGELLLVTQGDVGFEVMHPRDCPGFVPASPPPRRSGGRVAP